MMRFLSSSNFFEKNDKIKGVKTLLWIVPVVPLILILDGCGDQNPQIADKVKFRVNIMQQVVQVSFQMNQKYVVKSATTVAYQDLGKVFVTWTPAQNYNEIGSALAASPTKLEQPWPTLPFKEFPNGDSFPASVPSDDILNKWLKLDDNMRISLVFLGKPKVINGGIIQSSQFDALPQNFLATQKFLAANGDVIATISALGPSDNEMGGLYWFGNFGFNPFSDQPSPSNSTNSLKVLPNGDQEYEIEAKEPAEVLRYGRWWEVSLPTSFDEVLNGLSTNISNFAPKQ